MINIEVDADVWSELSDLEKTATMYHELAHDILNASHVKETKGHLMHPTAQFKDIVGLVESVVMIFEEYKSGNLRKFNKDTAY